METKKLMFKKGVGVQEIFLIIVIAGFLFMGTYLFLFENTKESNIEIPSRYNDTYNSFLLAQNQTASLTNTLKDKLSSNVSEANSAVQVAWNGFTGMLAVFKLPMTIIGYGRSLLDSMMGAVDGIPPIILTTIGICVIIFIVFSILSLYTGRDKI